MHPGCRRPKQKSTKAWWLVAGATSKYGFLLLSVFVAFRYLGQVGVAGFCRCELFVFIGVVVTPAFSEELSFESSFDLLK